ncbi:hypothetical protein IAD21_05597 [Abditibacteriota bacterium]|nr:hypothetical protein IAD21_05597 [Abditibacteriota bacterium]
MTTPVSEATPQFAGHIDGVESVVGPRRRPLSASDYEQMASLGLFEGLRVELIDGEIVEMPPIGESHARSVTKTAIRLTVALHERLLIRSQNPINAGTLGRPEPDVVLVPLESLQVEGPPSQAELVIEVSDSTLKYDQTDKASLYASLGIQDYWIINLVEESLEVRRQPIARSVARFGFDYASIQILTRGQSASPLVAPDVVLQVQELLP